MDRGFVDVGSTNNSTGELAWSAVTKVAFAYLNDALHLVHQ